MNWCRRHRHKVVFLFRQQAACPIRQRDIQMNSPLESVHSDRESLDLDSLAVARISAAQSAMVAEFCDNLDRWACRALFAILRTNRRASSLLIVSQIPYPRSKGHRELSCVVWFAIYRIAK